jgi:acyl-CoA thioesterase-1
MNTLIYFFGSGLAFFTGVAMILVGVSLVSLVRQNWSSRLATLLALFGLGLVAISATPLPYWLFAVAGTVTLVWLFIETTRRETVQPFRSWSRLSAALVWLLALALELPFHFTPSVKVPGRPPVRVIGDSISAGEEVRPTESWPNLLASSTGVTVFNHSQAGATVGSILKKSDRLPLGDGIILVELGGNDLLGGTPVAEFERDLDALLGKVCSPGRVVLLFELPLPPLANEFGRVQRRLAERHQVRLIPKRHFVSILTADRATIDSLHLSPRGHEHMAETVWQILRPTYRE